MSMTHTALAAALLLAGGAAQAQSEVTVYSYNNRPPFVIDQAKQDGMEYRLIAWLNKASAPTYHFTLKVVAAPEAKAMVEQDHLDGVLFGVSPLWFSEPVRARYLWTKPVLWDSNKVVSLESRKLEYTGPAALAGLRLAAVKGFNYPALTGAVAEGKLTRIDNGSEILALQMVARREADVAIVSEWTLLYAQLRMELAGDFFQADKPFSEFQRCILVPAAMKPLAEHLDRLLTNVRDNKDWQTATSL